MNIIITLNKEEYESLSEQANEKKITIQTYIKAILSDYIYTIDKEIENEPSKQKNNRFYQKQRKHFINGGILPSWADEISNEDFGNAKNGDPI